VAAQIAQHGIRCIQRIHHIHHVASMGSRPLMFTKNIAAVHFETTSGPSFIN
jgi:hypothetical protein